VTDQDTNKSVTMTTRSPEQTGEQYPNDSPLAHQKEATTTADVSPTKSTSPARPKTTGKPKRTLTPANILKTTANCALSFPILIRSLFHPKTSKALREKVSLGVTAINDCRFCAWGHSHWATSQGISLEEVNQILSNENDSLKATNPAEAAAILFGRHYAEQLDQIDPESVKNLHNYFSPAQVREIIGYVYFITFTNLSGNTVDALLDRVRGRGRPITIFECVVGAALAPILFTLVLLVKLGKHVGTDKRRAARHRVS
jgi:AhpD family alkylhydroperoxidase